MKRFICALAISSFVLVDASCESDPTDPSSRETLTVSPAAGFQTLQATTAEVTFTVFPGPPTPAAAFITAGPDGNLWFTEECGGSEGGCNNIGRMTTAGEISEFPLLIGGYYGPTGSGGPIVIGPDGNLWFTHYFANRIGKIDPSTGVITEFEIPQGYTFPAGITAGPDGNLWFTEFVGWRIGKITPAGAITEYPIPYHYGCQYGPTQITAGADGNLWFTVPEANIIARSTPAGVITEFPVPTPDSYPYGITAGPDGNVWFTETQKNKIGRITPTGEFTEFSLPPEGANPGVITLGPDGNLWFTVGLGRIGRITPAGVATEFSAPTPNGRPSGMTLGPDGNLWFSEYNANKIIRVNVTAYILYGFDSPIENVPAVNTAKAGSTIPVKWRLTDPAGMPISDPSSFGSLTSYIVTNGDFSGAPGEGIEATSPGNTGLQYLGNGYWRFNWKTMRSYAGGSQVMVLTLEDGTTRSAYFKFN
jgi:streptogramin lyase